jgi:hypothetical protein
MLLQIDASRHDWLEGRGPWLSLVGGIDDATGLVPWACFREHEDAQGYFQLFREVVRRGIPMAVYSDQHSIFFTTKKVLSLEEQLAGCAEPTQFGRLLEELGIRLIRARSPQAKGRVERLWGTFQDRLGSELRLAGAATREKANVVLQRYLPRHNRRFSVPPADPVPASVHPAHQRVLPQGRESCRRRVPSLHVLQLRSASHEPCEPLSAHPCEGRRRDRSRLEDRGDRRAARLVQGVGVVVISTWAVTGRDPK